MKEEMKVSNVAMKEEELGKKVSLIEHQANDLVIRTDDDFKMAGTTVKAVKTAQKQVEAYWEPMRKSTYAAYKSVTDHKKAMTEPLKKAEDILKKKMGEYQAEQERRRREEEERLRAIAKAEMERKLAEAAKAEHEGDAFGAEYAMTEAEALDTMAETAYVDKKTARVDGVIQKKAWTITGIDLKELPDEFAGIVIRPADESAIMRLIRASRGQINIPGVTFEETVSFAVKAS